MFFKWFLRQGGLTRGPKQWAAEGCVTVDKVTLCSFSGRGAVPWQNAFLSFFSFYTSTLCGGTLLNTSFFILVFPAKCPVWEMVLHLDTVWCRSLFGRAGPRRRLPRSEERDWCSCAFVAASPAHTERYTPTIRSKKTILRSLTRETRRAKWAPQGVIKHLKHPWSSGTPLAYKLMSEKKWERKEPTQNSKSSLLNTSDVIRFIYIMNLKFSSILQLPIASVWPILRFRVFCIINDSLICIFNHEISENL